MDMTPNNMGSPVPTSTPTDSKPVSPASSTKVLGIERRIIGFGFALFLMLVVLAFIYSQFAGQKAMAPVDTDIHTMPMKDKMMQTGSDPSSDRSLPTSITPDSVTDDLIDEALLDRNSTDDYAADEVADVEDGSNY